MCGIAGVFRLKAPFLSKPHLHHLGEEMGACMRARGPDSSGVFVDEQAQVMLSHRRLAIIDLTPTGHQPMTSRSGQTTLVFNGEIYNAEDIRAKLSDLNIPWRGTSDTEVLLEAVEHWGIEKTLTHLNGMFAFAAYDRDERTLKLARDRAGVKPLYYGTVNGVFVFASELKPIMASGVSLKFNDDVTPLFHVFNYIPAPYSIFKDIYKLEPAHFLKISASGDIKKSRYWSVDFTQCDESFTRENALDILNPLLKDAVSKRLIADVPVGVFLSGGIDSSLVTALAQEISTRPIKTFSIGFQDSSHNEAPFAAKVARHLKTDHTEIMFSEQNLLDLIPELPRMYDEPFADSSALPTTLVSKAARGDVTVALSGDGGDELFAGYKTYARGESLLDKLWPLPARKTFGRFLTLDPFPLKLQRLGYILKSVNPAQAFLNLIALMPPPSNAWKEFEGFKSPSLVPVMQHIDFHTYLPDDILTKVDRASMSVSLEAREPLLDYRLIEFAARLPLSLRRHQGQGKTLLRDVLDTYMPRELIDRPKQGFAVPMSRWLRGELKDWAGDLIHRASEHNDSDLSGLILHRWQEHQAGEQDFQHFLWGICMLESWKIWKQRDFASKTRDNVTPLILKEAS